MPAAALSLDHLRRYAVARTLFTPTTLPAAIRRLGFVQADPIRAPARAQDLILRHRVTDYRAGDLEARYPRLQIDEDCLVNYGFLPREHLTLMHPREPRRPWDAETQRKADDVLAFVRERRIVHPREVELHFAHGRRQNPWGGAGNLATHLLDGLHYRGLLRVKRRDSGTRVYEVAAHPPADETPAGRARRAAALIDLVVRTYAPLPAASLTYLVRLLGYGAPHLSAQTQAALRLARQHLAGATLDGTTWYWPADENPRSRRWVVDDQLRLLAPFDPIVWDRRRFTLFWGWTYKFEAYTPPAQRQFGYYALPMLWGDRVIGWGNVLGGSNGSETVVSYINVQAAQDLEMQVALNRELTRFDEFLKMNRP